MMLLVKIQLIATLVLVVAYIARIVQARRFS
jgi:hypothetical protein